MKTGNTRSPSRQPAATTGQPGRLSKYIAAGILTALILAVFVTPGLQAPPTAEAQDNNAATGFPGILDAANLNDTLTTVRPGMTLTVDITDIMDADGITMVNWMYQWAHFDGTDVSDIPDANAITYLVEDTDIGNALVVKVTFTDDLDNPEGPIQSQRSRLVGPKNLIVSNTGGDPLSRTSIALTATTPKFAQGFEAASGPTTDNFTLDFVELTFGNIGDPATIDDGITVTLNEDSSGSPRGELCTLEDPATFSTSGPHNFYAPTAGISTLCPLLEAGTAYHIVVAKVSGYTGNVTITHGFLTRTDRESANGWDTPDEAQHYSSSSWADYVLEAPMLIDVRGLPANAMGVPTISGIARANEVLTSDTSGITDADGLANPGFQYQWVRFDGTNRTDIPNATAATYTIVPEDIGYAIQVVVTFTDDNNRREGPLTSVPTDVVPDADVLVSNHGRHDTFGTLTTAISKLAQRFTTGAYSGGYNLTAVDLQFHNIADTATAGTELTVTLNEVSSSLPGDALCTLSDPGVFSSSGVHAFDSPLSADPCPALKTNTTYFIVVSRANSDTDAIAQSQTSTFGQNSGSLLGWTIGDTHHVHTDVNTPPWALATVATNLIIQVRGAPRTEIAVPSGWSLTPAGLVQGEKFRLLFSTSTSSDATSTSIDDYNSYVQTAAASGHTDIQAYSDWFTVVGSTGDVDARDNTRTTYTSEDKGVPIYWLNGNKVVDDYEDFYDGTWEDEANSTDESGSARSLSGLNNAPYTGSDNDGTEIFDSTVSRALGASNVMVGRPNNATDGEDPLTGATTVLKTDTHPFYALSGIFIAPNNPATGEAAITGRPRVGEELSADTSGITDPEGIDQDAFTYQWKYDDGNDITDINGATNATYILTDADAEKRVRVSISFTDDYHNSEGPFTSSRTEPVVPADVLVRNTHDKTTAEGPLSTTNSRYGQQFTTGSETDGYRLDSIGIHFASIATTSTAGSELTATLNADSSGLPGTVLCTLTDPATFTASGIQAFDVPTTGTTCPVLAASTKYFVVIERANNNTDAISVSATSPDPDDAGSAPNWSVADNGHYYDSANTPPWAQLGAGASLLVEVKGQVAVPNVTATGVPTISGTPQEGQTLTADTSAITDGNGLPSSFNFQWVHVAGSTQTDIDGATSSTYTLTEADLDKTIIVKVSFTDQDGHPEGPLASAPSGVVVAPDLLVKNTLQDASAADLTTSEARAAQAFTTGTLLAGYNLRSAGFKFGAIDDPESAGTDLQVTLNEVANSGAPGAVLCTLNDPTTFVPNTINHFTASATNECPLLAAETTYFAVLDRVAFTGSNSINIFVGSSTPEDTGSKSDWSIADRGYYGSSTTWTASTVNYRVEIRGAAGTELTVPVGWSLTPSGIVGGQKFRLMFITGTGTRRPNSTEIEDYNTYVQIQANAPNAHSDIKAYSSHFRVLGSTEDVDARDNTRTNPNDYTSVPIYWMGGAKVADDYGDLYDGTWDDETNPTNRSGSSSSRNEVFTGTGDGGSKSSKPLGSSNSVTLGRLNSSTGDPLDGNIEGPSNSHAKPYYALSNIFVVPNSDATGQPAITGTPRVNETLTADTSGITDPEGTANAVFTYQWIRVDGNSETDIDGATRSTYSPTTQDADKRLKVSVSFTDDQGFSEGPLVSEATFPIAGRNVLVRNTGQTVHNPRRIELDVVITGIAQSFTTGSAADGYNLESIGIRFTTIANPSTAGAELTATLNDDSSGDPGNALCTLQDPTTFTTSAVNTFTAPTSGSDMCPALITSTTYHLVVTRETDSDDIVVSATDSSAEDAGGAPGWVIGDGINSALPPHGTWLGETDSHPFMIEVKGASAVENIVSDHRAWVDNRQGDADTPYENTGSFTIAQGFRTGDTAGIFEVHEIHVDFDRGQPAPETIQVRIVESTAPDDDWEYATPSGFWKGGNYSPQDVTTDGVHTFRRTSGNSALRANTNYFLVISSTNNDPTGAAIVRMTDTRRRRIGRRLDRR